MRRSDVRPSPRAPSRPAAPLTLGRGLLGVVSGWLSVAAAGCTLPGVDLDGRPCPCAAGWRCDEGSNLCVPCSGDTCVLPASPDAAPYDASALDAEVLDATAPDASAGDASLADAFALPDAFELVSRCDLPVSGRLWCTGFEHGESDFSFVSASPDATFGTDVVLRGGHAGQAISPTIDRWASAFVRDLVLPNEAGGHIHLTGWVRRVGDTGRDASYFELSDAGYQYRIGLGLAADGRVRLLLGNAERFNVGLFGDDAAVPADTWVCMRMDVALGDPGSVRVWLMTLGGDEREVGVAWYRPDPIVTVHPGAGYGRVSVGLSTEVRASRVLLDEVALGTAPQPCVP